MLRNLQRSPIKQQMQMASALRGPTPLNNTPTPLRGPPPGTSPQNPMNYGQWNRNFGQRQAPGQRMRNTAPVQRRVR